jgi:hypothetical protein
MNMPAPLSQPDPSPEEWTRIAKSLGCAQLDDVTKHKLLDIAKYVMIERKWEKRAKESFPTKYRKNSAEPQQRIVSLATELLRETDPTFPSFLGDHIFYDNDGEAKLKSLREGLEWLRAELDYRYKRLPANLDWIRDNAWADARSIYELKTGRPAKVSVTDGKGRGPFVEFLKGVMAIIPGEKEPTGDQVRAFVRKPRHQRYSCDSIGVQGPYARGANSAR